MSYTVEQICQAHGVSRQAHYQHCAREQQRRQRRQQALDLVRSVRRKHPRMRKLMHLHRKRFRELGFGRDKLFGLLREEDLLIQRKRRRTSTTNSRHGLPTFENLTDTGYTAETVARAGSAPNQLWVADLTYINTKDGFCYASLVMDASSRKIIGFELSGSLSLEGSLAALRGALRGALREAPPGATQELVHHSDRGVQYCSKLYTQAVQEAGAEVSMAAVGNPYENAQAERVIGTLKREYFLDSLFASEAAAELALEEAVRLYNTERPHQALSYKTPAEVHAAGETPTPEYAMAVN